MKYLRVARLTPSAGNLIARQSVVEEMRCHLEEMEIIDDYFAYRRSMAKPFGEMILKEIDRDEAVFGNTHKVSGLVGGCRIEILLGEKKIVTKAHESGEKQERDVALRAVRDVLAGLIPQAIADDSYY